MTQYLITGAGFGNKGAESMLYTLITELREKDPDSEIVISCVSGYDEITLNKFKNIIICKENQNCINYLLHPIKNIMVGIKVLFYNLINSNKKNKYNILYYYKTSNVILDISGFALSSQISKKPHSRLLGTIQIANKYKKRIFLLPQSFGPFNFNCSNKKMIKILSKVDKIFCRETDGYNLLKSFKLNNIILANDIVLESNKTYQNIYENFQNKTYNFNNSNKKALIIPNIRVFERTNQYILYNTYKKAIEFLLSEGYTIYISYYDLEDVSICNKIKLFFSSNNNVVFIDEYFNCIDFANLLSNFDILISSRFHSIVHAYKNYIPCIVIGWAIKYIELTKNLGQENYMFDARNNINMNEFIEKLKNLIENQKEESYKIKERILKIQEQNCFDILWSCLK